MEPTTPVKPEVIIPQSPLPKNKLIMLVLGILILLAIIFFSLYYFKIIKFKTAQTLPPAGGPTPQVQSNPTQPTKYTLPCPVPKEFCSQAKQVIYQSQTFGLGFVLPKNTAITAVFPGTLESGSQQSGILKLKKHPLRWIKGTGQFEGLIATYSFFGVPASDFQGETIATTGDQTFPKEEPYNGVSLIFTLTKGDKFQNPLEFEFK